MVEMSQSALVRYVFNYNALEAVSIAVSTTILLAGMVRCSRWAWHTPLCGRHMFNIPCEKHWHAGAESHGRV
jgi:hypothetical protein